jgi:hypothetical protein
MTLIHTGPPPNLGDVYTWSDALSQGLTRRQAEQLSEHRVMSGVYAADPDSWHGQVRAALHAGGPQAAICGPTALRLAKVDLPSRLIRDPRVWIAVPHQQRGPRRVEIRTVRSRHPLPLIRLQQLTAVQLPYCWLQLAPEASLDELVELADAMTCRQHPVTTAAGLRQAVADAWGRPGVALALAALGLMAPGTDSIPETDLRLVLVRAGLGWPTVNLVIRDSSGRVLYLLDLAYEEAKVAIEYDGANHVGDHRRLQSYTTRRRHLEDLGWRLISVTSADLYDHPHSVVASVRQALAARR